MAIPDPIVYIVDDDADVRRMLDWLISSVGLETRVFANADAFLDADLPEQPGCLILDVRMPGTSGLDLQEKLSAQETSFSIIFLTGHGDIPMATRAMVRGAFDFIEKPFNNQQLLDVVNKAIEHSRQELRASLLRRELRALHGSLTERERTVFELVVKGRTSKEVAGDLGLSERTVDVHRRRIMEKMNVRNVVELVRAAVDGALVDDRSEKY